MKQPPSFQDVERYLVSGKYPTGSSLNAKRSIRRSAHNNFKMENGVLYYRSPKKAGFGPSSSLVPARLGVDGLGPWRKVVKSEAERRNILMSAHSTGSPAPGSHHGRDRTASKIETRYWWPNWYEDVKMFVRCCAACQQDGQKKKSFNIKPHARPQDFKPQINLEPQPSQFWDKIGIDMIGPLPMTSSGNRYIMAVTDYYSKWAEAKALQAKEGEGVARFLAELFLRYGMPRVIVSDCGREFRSKFVEQACKLMGINRRRTNLYHPKCEELTERHNLSLEIQLLKETQTRTNWDQNLDRVLFAYRTSKHVTTKYSPFFLLYFREATLPEDVPAISNTPVDFDNSMQPYKYCDVSSSACTQPAPNTTPGFSPPECGPAFTPQCPGFPVSTPCPPTGSVTSSTALPVGPSFSSTLPSVESSTPSIPGHTQSSISSHTQPVTSSALLHTGLGDPSSVHMGSASSASFHTGSITSSVHTLAGSASSTSFHTGPVISSIPTLAGSASSSTSFHTQTTLSSNPVPAANGPSPFPHHELTTSSSVTSSNTLIDVAVAEIQKMRDAICNNVAPNF